MPFEDRQANVVGLHTTLGVASTNTHALRYEIKQKARPD
jgi:hypothetical protein